MKIRIGLRNKGRSPGPLYGNKAAIAVFSVFWILCSFSLSNSVSAAQFNRGLEIYGSKEVEFNSYSYKGDFNQFIQKNPMVITDGKFDQHTRFQIRGEVSPGTSIQAVFDDSNEREEDEKILLNVKGNQFEMALGRIALELPGTRFLLNNKKGLGIYYGRSFKKLHSSFLVSRSEGKEEREQFFGQGLQREFVLKNAPVVAGSEKITLDGTVLQRGVDYQVDYEGGSFQIMHKWLPLENTSSLIVEYESSRTGSTYKNRVFGTRHVFTMDPDQKIALSMLMEKDQVDLALAQSSAIAPHQLNLYGLDGELSRGPYSMKFEMAASRDKQDILSHTLPVLDGYAMDLSGSYHKGNHRFSLRKERIDPDFRSIGKNKFLRLSEDSNLVSDVDQQSLGYEFSTTSLTIEQNYRSSRTNLKDDPTKESTDFQMLSGGFHTSYGRVKFRGNYKNENAPVYKANLPVRYEALRKRGVSASADLHKKLELILERENERKETYGLKGETYQTSQFKMVSRISKNLSWNYGAKLRETDDLLAGIETNRDLNHQLRIDMKKGRNLNSQLEFVSRQEEDLVGSSETKYFSSGFDVRYKKGRELSYNLKLKQEQKRRVIQETSNLDLSELMRSQRNQKTYLTPTNPVQTFVLSQQLRLRHHKHFQHRLSYRVRSEDEKNLDSRLSSNEALDWDFKWDLPRDYRLRYRWGARDRYNRSSSLDRKTHSQEWELSRNLKNNMTLTTKHNKSLETDYFKGNYQADRDYSIRLDRTINSRFQTHGDLLLKNRGGVEQKEDWSLGTGVVYTPVNSDLRLGLDLSAGRSKERKTQKTGDTMSYKVNIQKQIFDDAHLEGTYKFEKDGPSTLGTGYTARIMNVRVSMDF